MANDQRGAVVSVRITDEEQARLRQAAQARGTSVSELVRSVVVREVTPPEPVGPAVSVGPTSGPVKLDQGIFWHSYLSSSVLSPGTVTIQAG